jgi:hypothetical protein
MTEFPSHSENGISGDIGLGGVGPAEKEEFTKNVCIDAAPANSRMDGRTISDTWQNDHIIVRRENAKTLQDNITERNGKVGIMSLFETSISLPNSGKGN